MFKRILAAALLSAFGAPAGAADFFVSGIDDSGAGSLRQAIIDANAAATPPHTITFDATYPAQGMIELFSALPLLQVEVQIDGADREPAIMPFDASNSFPLLTTSQSLRVRGLAMWFGRGERGACIGGEGITDAHTLTLERMRFVGCLAASTTPGVFAFGGAVGWPSQGAVVVTDSVFENNAAASVLNETARGGAIASHGPLRVEGSRFVGNIVNGGIVIGGAIYNAMPSVGSIEIGDSVFTDNLALPETVVSAYGTGGAISVDCATCTVVLERNHFGSNQSVDGGAIALRGNAGVDAADVTVHNTGFVDNTASNWGGALYANGTRLELRHTSFMGNGAAMGGHVAAVSSTVPEWSNSVLAPVAVGSANGCGVGAVASIAVGNFVLDGSNGCNATLPGSAAVEDLGIVGLDDSGFMPVLRFATDSPVVDGGDEDRCLDHDALGHVRPQDGNNDGFAQCDAGTVELRQHQLFANGFEG